MTVNYITPTNGANGPNNFGLYRNPCPMSDGKIIAVFTPTSTSFNFGYDTNIGTASLPASAYHFRLYTLASSGSLYTTNTPLTAGISNTAIYWSGSTLVTNSATMWELQPVEVRARPIPIPMKSTVMSVEQQVFAEEDVDLPTFQADLAARNLALVISRNVTARDVPTSSSPTTSRFRAAPTPSPTAARSMRSPISSIYRPIICAVTLTARPTSNPAAASSPLRCTPPLRSITQQFAGESAAGWHRVDERRLAGHNRSSQPRRHLAAYRYQQQRQYRQGALLDFLPSR